MFIAVLFAHWIADFLLQSDWMAINKSSDFKALGLHVLVYSMAMTVLMAIIAACVNILPDVGPTLPFFFIITFATHFVTDAITSRITKWLYTVNRHYFFVVIGLDQWIHAATLALTIDGLRMFVL